MGGSYRWSDCRLIFLFDLQFASQFHLRFTNFQSILTVQRNQAGINVVAAPTPSSLLLPRPAAAAVLGHTPMSKGSQSVRRYQGRAGGIAGAGAALLFASVPRGTRHRSVNWSVTKLRLRRSRTSTHTHTNDSLHHGPQAVPRCRWRWCLRRLAKSKCDCCTR